MPSNALYAVLTGDIVGSTKFSPKSRMQMIDAVRKFALPGESLAVLNIYRGDSFQLAVRRAEEGLAVAVMLRAKLMSLPLPEGIRADARIAIGVGGIEYASKRLGGDGEAFRASGRLIDRMPKDGERLGVATPWPARDPELSTEAVVLDWLMRGWTRNQAIAVFYRLRGMKQKDIANAVGVRQQNVSKRLQAAKMGAVRIAVERFREVVSKEMGEAR